MPLVKTGDDFSLEFYTLIQNSKLCQFYTTFVKYQFFLILSIFFQLFPIINFVQFLYWLVWLKLSILLNKVTELFPFFMPKLTIVKCRQTTKQNQTIYKQTETIL